MQIAYDIFKSSGFSGNRTYTIELVHALADQFPNHRYQLLTNWGYKEKIDFPGNHTDSIQIQQLIPNPLLLGKVLRKPVKSFSNSLLRAKAKQCDLFHATNPTHFPIGIRNGIVTLHDLIALRNEPWTQEGSKQFYHQHIGAILEQAKAICCVSEYTAHDASSRFPGIKNKIFVTPLGSNPLFKPLSKDSELLEQFKLPQKPYILYVGEIQPRKNIHSILTSYDQLPRHIREACELILIGSIKSRGNKQYFEDSLNALQSQQGIHYLQNISNNDLARFYSNALLFIFPSFFEGFGLPVLEAMSCGCPVITSNTTSLKEVAADAALTVNPDEPEDIFSALTAMLENESLRSSMAVKGIDRSAQFCWNVTAAKTMDAYRHALA